MLDKKWSYKVKEMEEQVIKLEFQLEQLSGNDLQNIRKRLAIYTQLDNLHEAIHKQKLSEITIFDLW